MTTTRRFARKCPPAFPLPPAADTNHAIAVLLRDVTRGLRAKNRPWGTQSNGAGQPNQEFIEQPPLALCEHTCRLTKPGAQGRRGNCYLVTGTDGLRVACDGHE